jgi:hypothetical protein
MSTSSIYLKIQVVRAENLCEEEDTCQPMCEVRVGDEEVFKTCAVQDSVDPVWKETYIFGNSRKLSKTSVLSMKVTDAQNGKELGICKIPLSELKCDDRPDMIPISQKLSSASGFDNPKLGVPKIHFMCRMTQGQHPDIVFEGELEKLGGGLGGRANWSTRWFVLLPDKLCYYESRSTFTMGAKPKGVILLNSYFCSKEHSQFALDNEFEIHAVPKSLKCRAKTEEEMNLWIKTLNLASKNVEELMK